ncbi:hypothetical protein DVH05_004898 [Phytophthora capsici]|nr:hypothetical protein DVH05_004898 [Phytophthora capsici]
MEKLGYSRGKLLATAQQVSADWDMSDVDDNPGSGMASILDYAGAKEEEYVLEEEVDHACFPEFRSDTETDRDKVKAIILEKVDDARQLRATTEFAQEFETILMQFIDVLIGRDPPVDMP